IAQYVHLVVAENPVFFCCTSRLIHFRSSCSVLYYVVRFDCCPLRATGDYNRKKTAAERTDHRWTDKMPTDETTCHARQGEDASTTTTTTITFTTNNARRRGRSEEEVKSEEGGKG
ncbi:unnamed protein product, partial [Ectocarpus sp. 12 AP-2014]